MAVQRSGAVYLSDIQGELGGSNPIYMSEYRKGAGIVGGNPSWANYGTTLSGTYAPNVPSSGSVYMSQFHGADQAKTWNYLNTPCTTGVAWTALNYPRFASVALSSLISLQAGDTFVATAQLDPRTAWKHPGVNDVVSIHCTYGVAQSLLAPNYYDKDHYPYIAYDGGNTITVGVYYAYKSTNYYDAGTYLQGVCRT